MLNAYEEDECCGNALGDALLSGSLDGADSWTHEECGQEWKPEVINGLRYWRPQVFVEVF